MTTRTTSPAELAASLDPPHDLNTLLCPVCDGMDLAVVVNTLSPIKIVTVRKDDGTFDVELESPTLADAEIICLDCDAVVQVGVPFNIVNKEA